MRAVDLRNTKLPQQLFCFGKPTVFVRTSPAPAALAGNTSNDINEE